MIEKIETLFTKNWFQYLLLGAITLLAGVMRFYKLGQWSFWIDEIFTINRAQIHFSDLLSVIRNLPTSLWLPVSVILTAISLTVAGVSEWSARLPAAVIGILSIPLLYFPVRRLVGTGTALIFALLLAISPWHLFWSQNARFYTALMLFYSLAGLSFFMAFEHNRPKYLLVFYGLLYLAASERLITIFLLPVLTAYLLTIALTRFELPRGLTRRNLLIFGAPVVLVAVVEIIRFMVSGSSILAYAWDAFAGQRFDDPPRLLAAMLFNLGLPVVALGLVSGIESVWQKNRLSLFLLLSALLPLILLLALNPIMFTKDRYIFMTLPSWLILAAMGIRGLFGQARGNSRLLALGVLLVFVAEAAGTNLLYYQVNNGGRRDWRGAFEIIEQRSRPDDIIVTFWPEFGPYYLDRQIQPWVDVRPGQVANSSQRTWFLVDSETEWGNLELRDWVIRNAQLIDILYLRMPEDDFHLRLYLYDPPG